jgi:hypothetical protein
MAARLKLNKQKFLEACRAALDATQKAIAQAQAEIETYDWRAEAQSRVKELSDSLADPSLNERAFSELLYEVRREFRRSELEYNLEHLQCREEEIKDLIGLSEMKAEEEITVSTTDHFIKTILRQARESEHEA